MDVSVGDERQIKIGGLIIAITGFALTRVTVVVVTDPMASLSAFVTTGLFPLGFGLSLTAFGVSLAVSTYESWYVNTVTLWTLLGTVGMGLVAGLTLLNPMLAGDPLGMPTQFGPFVANTLIGGAVGGALIGVRSARNRRQRRALARQSTRATVLNRILRDEVLNAVTAIRGYIEYIGGNGSDEESIAAVRRGTERIREAVEDVGFLARTADNGSSQEPTRLGPAMQDALADVGTQFPDATIDADIAISDDCIVRASDRLRTVFVNLCETAVERHPDGAPRIRLSARADESAASVTVVDDGDPLTTKQQDLLADGDIPEYDDPEVTFGYHIVSLLVDQYGGDITVERADGETRVTVHLPLATDDETTRGQHGLEPATIGRVTVASLVAGVAMGLVFHAFANTVPVIGSLYGVPSVAVGWITHLFHSVVFGLLFAAALRRPLLRNRVDSLPTTLGPAAAYALLLALVAAGIVMPLWLNAVGVPSQVPLVSAVGVFAHVVWGVVLGGVYWLLLSRE